MTTVNNVHHNVNGCKSATGWMFLGHALWFAVRPHFVGCNPNRNNVAASNINMLQTSTLSNCIVTKYNTQWRNSIAVCLLSCDKAQVGNKAGTEISNYFKNYAKHIMLFLQSAWVIKMSAEHGTAAGTECTSHRSMKLWHDSVCNTLTDDGAAKRRKMYVVTKGTEVLKTAELYTT